MPRDWSWRRSPSAEAPQDKHTLPELDKAAAILAEENMVIHDRIITAIGAEAVEEFTEAIIEAVMETKVK